MTGNNCKRLGVPLNSANKALLAREQDKSVSSEKNSDAGSDVGKRQRSFLLEEQGSVASTESVSSAASAPIATTSVATDSIPESAMPESQQPVAGGIMRSPSFLTPTRSLPAKSPSFKSPSFKSPDNLPEMLKRMNVSSDDNDSVAHSVNTEDITGSADTQSSQETVQIQDGTREYPYLSFIDLNHPEMGRDFEAQFCQQMKRRGWRRPGIHVRRLINTLDIDSWSAEMPGDDEFPQFKGRCFLVRRPAWDAIQKQPNLYHKKLKIDDVKEVHLDQLSQKKHMDWVYYLVYTNSGVELDNSHFAGEKTSVVKTHHNAVKVSSSENEFCQDLRFMYVYWELALSTGGVKVVDGEEKQLDKRKMFD